MATEKELQDEMERLRAQVQGLTVELEEAKTGLAAFGKATVKGAADVTKGLGSFAVNVGKGDTSFKSLNSVVDIASNALAGMAKAIPFAGEALSAGIKATAEASKFMLEQLDTTTKAFNDLSRVGALTERGMSGLQQQFVASQLSFGAFNKQVTENAQALARFKGMAGDGADVFAAVTGRLADLSEGSDDSLRRLGMSTDEIGASTAAFITQQTRLGLAQGRSNAELAAGTKAYAIELDALQKVTGLSREAIQKQQDAALSESRFRANYDTLIAQGRENEAKALMKLQTQISAIGSEAGQGIRDLLSGAGTDAAKKLMASTGGAAQDILDRVKEGKLDETRAAQELQAAMKKTADAARNNAQYVEQGSSAFLDYAQQSDIINAQIVDGQLVRRRQEKQMAAGTDKLTDTTVAAEKALQKMNIEMQQLGFTFMHKASPAVKAMTESMAEFVEFVNEKISGGAGPAVVTPEQKNADEIAKKTAGILADKNATPEQKRQAEQEEIAAAARARQANLEEQNRRRTARREAPLKGASASSPGDAAAEGRSAPAGPTAEQLQGPVSAGPKNKEQQEYYDKMYSSLLAEAQKVGLKNAEVIAKLGATQSSLETGYGKQMVGNNAFGIKAKLGAPSVTASTQEFENGQMVTKNQNFRAYAKPEDSAADYIKFLQENSRYKGVLSATNLNDAIAAQGRTGYASDPNYANKLAGIANKYSGTAVANLAGPATPYQLQSPTAQPREELTSKPATAAQPSTSPVADSAILMALLNKQDEVITVLKNQLAVQQKQLQLSN